MPAGKRRREKAASAEERLAAKKGIASTQKQCLGPCHEILPRSEQYFDRSARRRDGFKTWCKRCLTARKKGILDRVLSDSLQKLDTGILASVLRGEQGGPNVPHITQVIEMVMAHLGGVRGFATYYIANLLAAPPGSQTRERMLNKLMAMVQAASSDERVNKPRELESEEELQARVAQYEKEQNLQVIHGPSREAS